MKSKLLAAVAAFGMASAVAQAGVNVQWYVAYGVYPQGAADVTSVTAGTGLLANNGSGSTILQLIWAGADNAIDIADPNQTGGGNGDYVSDDDVVWATITAVDGAAGYDEWVFNSVTPVYVNATFTAGFVYARVFQDETPAGGEYYHDTSLLALSNVGGDITQAQLLPIGSDSAGVSTENQMIVPEPSAVMLAGLGALVLAVRRRRQA